MWAQQLRIEWLSEAIVYSSFKEKKMIPSYIGCIVQTVHAKYHSITLENTIGTPRMYTE